MRLLSLTCIRQIPQKMSYKMHNYKRLPMISLSRKVLGVAVASSLLMLSNADATGLGRLTVLSALGQPLRAEIELTSPNKDEVSSLVPKLASIDAFKQASIDFNPALLSMHFSVEPRGAGYVIRVTSSQAMNEPFVDLLLEMNSSSGKLLREYTFLLDPAELRSSQSAQVASPVSIATQAQVVPSPTSGSSVKPQASVPVAPTATPTARQKRTPAKSAEMATEIKSAGDYQVKRGDTLSKVAGEYKSEGISLDQMLVSLYKANPQAFSGNNMNRLKTGQILSIPDAETNRANSVSESHSIVMAHATDFNSYRNKLAGQIAEAPAQKATTSKQTVSGTITAKVKEVSTATSESLDKLKLSKVTPSASAKAGISKVAAEEDKVARDRAVADANARVKELEKNVSELQKILEIKNKDLAEKQAAAKTEAKAVVSKVASIPAAATPSAASAASAISASSSEASASASAPAPVIAASTPSVASAAVSAPPKRKILPPPPPPEPGILDRILEGGFVLPIGALVALLAGYGIFSSRRKKKSQQFDDSILTGSSMKANSMFGSTGGQSVDTNNSVFNSNFAPSASQLDANEVDPVAEADVYIAYGRDSQAEEILKEALRTQPDRHAVRVKLLEIYFNRKDPRSFERLASELYGMTSGEGDEWAQATSMGVVLEPTNPLYAGGKGQAGMDSGATLGSSTEPLEELDPEALLGNSLSDDMLESISIIDTASGLTEDIESTEAKKAETPIDIASLDFDLDIPGAADEHAVPMLPEESAKPASREVIEEEPVVDFGTIDFDLGTTDSIQEVVAESAQDDQRLNALELEQSDSNEIAFESSAVPENLLTSDMQDTSAAGSAGASEQVLDAAPAVPSTEAFEFDLSGIDLDLGAGLDKSNAPVSAGEDMQSYNAEMATKLDLAVAYHEIGDKEGARELLDEVLKGGTPDQIEKAQSMLAQLV